jgi:hypothetical protein
LIHEGFQALRHGLFDQPGIVATKLMTDDILKTFGFGRALFLALRPPGRSVIHVDAGSWF